MKSICIMLTDPNSISEFILLKSLNYMKKSKLNKIYIIGDKKLFSKLYKKTSNYKKMKFINLKLKKQNNFKYLDELVNKSLILLKKEKIRYLINMPLNKKKFLNKKFIGFTEYFSHKIDKKQDQNMLLYSDNFSVCPLTTHEQIKNVEKKITKKKLEKTISNIINFYKKILKKKLNIIVLGLNPHASKDLKGYSKDLNCIKPVVDKFRKKNVYIKGPISADTAFDEPNAKTYIGMYHDQVLIPFKLLNRFKGINITIGKNVIRMSPDHGTAEQLINKVNKINNESFIECIKFCEKY